MKILNGVSLRMQKFLIYNSIIEKRQEKAVRMPELEVSIVVRTYTEKRWHYLVECLDSLLVQSKHPDQIVVVVDHNPALLEKVAQQYPTVDAVENILSQGSSGAWNSGILNVTGDIVAFIDDDARADPGWLAQLVSHYSNPEVYGVGGHIQPVWESGKPLWFPEEFNWVVGCSYLGLPVKVEPVRNMIGCNMSFRRVAFRIAGGFRDGMGHVGSNPIGCDETEICIRLRQKVSDIILLHDPDAVVQHHVPAERTTWQYFLRRCALEGRSKAQVAYHVGVQDGLKTERRYSSIVLPRGVLRNMKQGFLGKRGAFLRGGAIITGLLTTGINYVLHSIRLSLSKHRNEDLVANIFPDI